MMQGNRQETMAYRFHVDAQHPDTFGDWLGDQNTPVEVWFGLKFRPRINQRHRAGLNRDYLHRWQYRRRDVAGGVVWSAWANVTNASTDVQITLSDFYDDRDQMNVLHFANEQGSGISDTTNAFYLEAFQTTDQIRWRSAGNFRMEPEINLKIVAPTEIGNEFQLRFVRHNGDVNEFADVHTANFTVIAAPPPTPTFPEGPLDEAIATLLDDLGLGDFSAPATATEPPIVVGEMIEDPDALICVIPTGGGAVHRVIGEMPSVTVVSRDISYRVAQDRAKAVEAALDQHSGQRLNRPIARIQPETEIVYQGRDGSGRQGGRAVFSQSFTVYSRQKFIFN